MAGISKKNEGRISLALSPATAKGIRQLAYLCDKSVNEYVSAILDSVVTRNSAMLQAFQEAEISARNAAQLTIDPAQVYDE